jgi:ribonucleoside-triphosphate reductase
MIINPNTPEKNLLYESFERSPIKVKRSDETVKSWNKEFIVNSLRKETSLTEKWFNVPRIMSEDAARIALFVERKIFRLYDTEASQKDNPMIPTSLVREMVVAELLTRASDVNNYKAYATVYKKHGVPLYDAIGKRKTPENDFYKTLEAMNIDEDFVELFKSIPKEQLDNLGLTKIDVFNFRREYLNGSPVQAISIDPNANVQGKSPVNIRSEQIKPWNKVEGLYWFWKYATKLFGINRADYLIQEVLMGHVYIHDLTKWDQPYCFSISTMNILDQGRPYSRLVAKPPKHLRALVGQIAELVMDLSQEQAGAVAVSSMALAMAVTMKMELDSTGRVYSDKDIEQEFQTFVHIVNNQFRIGGDSPFTNFSIFSPTFLKKMYGDNRHSGYSFDDIESEVNRVQNIVLDFMSRGDPTTGMMYRFPIATINIHPADVDTPEVDMMLRKNNRGFFNINVTDQVAMCCRLQMKKKERMSSLGTGGDNIGSLRIVALNLPSIVYQSKKERRPVQSILADRLEVAKDLLVCHLEIIRRLVDGKFLKFFNIHWQHLKMFYLTVGIHGLAEMVGMMESKIGSDDWVVKCKEILLTIRNFCDEQTEWDFNYEAVPAEGATAVMARSNRIFYRCEDRFYSNQFVPLYLDIPVHERLSIESDLTSIVTGGTMTFINLSDMPDEDSMVEFQKWIIKNTKIPQFAINIGMSHCKNEKCGSSFAGRVHLCPKCRGEFLEFLTRIVGYFVPESMFSPVRKEELDTRYWYAARMLTMMT